MEILKELEKAIESEELAGQNIVLFLSGLLIGLAVGVSVLLESEKKRKPINLN